jgi:hypothetical protein
MGLGLFDYKIIHQAKISSIPSLSMTYLFDGYLTGLKSYQQMPKLFYLTSFYGNQLKKAIKHSLTMVYILNG